MLVSELRKTMIKYKIDHNKDKALFCSLLLDQVLKISKSDGNREPTDADITTAAKRSIKMTEQSKAAGINVDNEIEFYNQYIPKQMSPNDLINLIAELINKPDASFPSIMKELKTHNVDMREAAKLVKKQL